METHYASFGVLVDGAELAQAGAGPTAARRQAGLDYETAVRWHLDLIARSDTGRALLRAMQRTGKRVAIRPWKGTDNNATTTPLDERSATRRGEFAFTGNGRVATTGRWVRDPMIGTGTGSDVEIRYSPRMFGFGGSSNWQFAPTSAGAGASAVLFHEMSHAYRDMRGHAYLGPMMGAHLRYDDEEEFFAILLSNIFVTDPTSAVQVRTLRADHWGFALLPAAQSTAQGFVRAPGNSRIVGRLTSQEPGLTSDLRAVQATFNPVKEYYNFNFDIAVPF